MNQSELESFDADEGDLDFGIIFDEIPLEKVICIFYDSRPGALRFTDPASALLSLIVGCKSASNSAQW